jgi:hypothetical protein
MTLNMVEVCFSEISGFLQTTRRYNPKEFKLEDPLHLWFLINVHKLLRKYTNRRKHFFTANSVKFSFSWGEVRLSPVGTSATLWPTESAPDDV